MGFPAGIQLATVAFGIPLTVTGKDVVTTVTVKPTARVIWAATGQPLPEFADSFTAEAGQLGSFQVPFIDQAGFIDSTGADVTDFAYQVTAEWRYGNERPITWSKNLKPLLGQSGPIDLDLVPDGPVSIPVTAPTAAVLGFGGRTGFVTLQESDLPSRLSVVELSATYARAKSPGTFVALGDSTTGVDYGSGILWPGVLAAISGRKLSLLKNAGVGGNTTAQMLARVQADVVALNPSICVLLPAMNDVLGDVPLATTQANITAIADAVNAAGIEFVIGTNLPRNGHTSGGNIATIRTLNSWIKLWAATKGYRVIDFNKALATTRSGEYLPGHFYDATHPNAVGHARMAEAAAAVLVGTSDAAFVPSLTPHETEIDYVPSMPATIPYSNQIVYNALMYDLNADSQPDHWTQTAAAGIARTVVTDSRFAGRALKLVGTANNATYTQEFTLPATEWAIGDKLRLVTKLACDAASGIPSGSGLEVRLDFTGPGTNVKAVQKWGYVMPLGTASEFGVDGVIPAGTTAVKVTVSANLGGGSGTFLVGEVGAYNLTAVNIANTPISA